MTYVTHSGHAPIRQRLSDLSARWAERRAQYRTYRSTLAELSAMSSHELTDLGVHPADIRSIAQEAAFGA